MFKSRRITKKRLDELQLLYDEWAYCMIESFKHKGLQELFEKSKTSRLPQERLKKIKMILAAQDAAQDLKDLNIPAFRLHKLKKPPLNGFYSLDVSGNYRIVFWFEDGKVNEVDYLDTH